MVKVFYSKNGQVKVTIPKIIAIAMQLQHGCELEFIFNGKTWEIRKKNKK
jgi:bifunctional DNA-binding transcriptional regulator/antitoxin component of YhaV-PrlF toxin-antitoxin module